MIDVAEALALIFQYVKPPAAELVAVEESLGLVLAENVVSDIDSPPHDKSLVDGYAVIAADLSSGPRDFTVLEEVTAGEVPTKQVRSGQATRIMTGAPLPDGADAVVMVESSETLDEQTVRLLEYPATAGQNIMWKATSLARGQCVLKRGRLISPADIGLMSEVGTAIVLTNPAASVAVLATGNELVSADQVPQDGQIRNSNGPMLTALAQRSGARTVDLGIARDSEEDLRRLIRTGLNSDILVLSGGVSAGVLDLVPKVLGELGVRQVFHKVRLKPGKPLWFGIFEDAAGDTLVFGLPGNPVSSLVCFELFVRTAIATFGNRPSDVETPRARITEDLSHKGDRETYWPGFCYTESNTLFVRPLDWKGSADLCTLSNANCLIRVASPNSQLKKNETVEVRRLV